MGIKGIYKELGPGERISLANLAISHLESTGRPLRLAIDVSIWQFQIRAAQGGTNPALRAFFYRITRLLTLAIDPLFVFDGPKRPAWKRNKRVGGPGGGDRVGTAMAKRLIMLFGFSHHDAPGEAEAECALLQREGIVDAVLSEDVDTLMFGCRRFVRNWSPEGKGNIPTHVNLYEADKMEMDREGMVLVALMSGGDYITEGVPGCGPKVACEAARAGYGRRLCRIKISNNGGSDDGGAAAFASWREDLIHDLRTNENKVFRTKHKAMQIPADFPNVEVLRYYTHPVVSPPSTLDKLRRSIRWNLPIRVVELREFVRDTFDWNYRGGALKFVKTLAPGMLVKRLLLMPEETQALQNRADDEELREIESQLVKRIKNVRRHCSTDSTPELRVTYVPMSIVGFDPYQEEEEVIEASRGGLALNSDDEFEGGVSGDGPKTTTESFKAEEPNLLWIAEAIVKIGAPITAENWDAAKRAKEQKNADKETGKKAAAKAHPGRKKAALMDTFVRVSKRVERNKAGVEREETDNIMQATPLPLAKARPIRNAGKNVARSKEKVGADPFRIAGTQLAPKVTKPGVWEEPTAITAKDSRKDRDNDDNTEPVLLFSSLNLGPYRPSKATAPSPSTRSSQQPPRALAAASVATRTKSNPAAKSKKTTLFSSPASASKIQTTLASFFSRAPPPPSPSLSTGSKPTPSSPASPPRQVFRRPPDLDHLFLSGDDEEKEEAIGNSQPPPPTTTVSSSHPTMSTSDPKDATKASSRSNLSQAKPHKNLNPSEIIDLAFSSDDDDDDAINAVPSSSLQTFHIPAESIHPDEQDEARASLEDDDPFIFNTTLSTLAPTPNLDKRNPVPDKPENTPPNDSISKLLSSPHPPPSSPSPSRSSRTPYKVQVESPTHSRTTRSGNIAGIGLSPDNRKHYSPTPSPPLQPSSPREYLSPSANHRGKATLKSPSKMKCRSRSGSLSRSNSPSLGQGGGGRCLGRGKQPLDKRVEEQLGMDTLGKAKWGSAKSKMVTLLLFPPVGSSSGRIEVVMVPEERAGEEARRITLEVGGGKGIRRVWREDEIECFDLTGSA